VITGKYDIQGLMIYIDGYQLEVELGIICENTAPENSILNKVIDMHDYSFKTRKLQPICLLLLMMATLIITVPFVPQSNAQATQTLYYDNGEIAGYTSGFIYGVKFSLPAGVSSANILTVRYMWYAIGGTLVIHITGPDHLTELTDPISTTAAVGTAGPAVWNEVDVSNKSIVVSGDFYVAVKKTGTEDTGIIMDNSTDGVRSFYGPSMDTLTNPSTSNYMIRVVIQPLTPTQTPTPTTTILPSTSPSPTQTSAPTQTPTVTPYSSQNPTPSPTIPEFPQTIMLLMIAAMFLTVTLGLVAYRRHSS